MIGSLFNAVGASVDGAVKGLSDDPVGYVGAALLQPVQDSVEVLKGLSEGELRTKAIARLGADVVSGMAVSEIIEVLSGGE